jgi:hypothetical protein
MSAIEISLGGKIFAIFLALGIVFLLQDGLCCSCRFLAN